MANEKHFKYYRNIIYDGKNFEISTKVSNASLETLQEILKDNPLRRRDIINKTGWTRGQVAGLLFRGKKHGLLEIKNKKICLVKTKG